VVSEAAQRLSDRQVCPSHGSLLSLRGRQNCTDGVHCTRNAVITYTPTRHHGITTLYTTSATAIHQHI